MLTTDFTFQTHATPLLLLRDSYEAIALAAFLGLLLAYAEDVAEGEGVVGVMAKVRCVRGVYFLAVLC
jgi:hypothetical protein